MKIKKIKLFIVSVCAMFISSALCAYHSYGFNPGDYVRCSFDLRYINALERNGEFEKAEKLFKRLISESGDAKDFYDRVFYTRKEFRQSKLTWACKDPKQLYQSIRDKIRKGESIEALLPDDLPLSVFDACGGGPSAGITMAEIIKDSKLSGVKVNKLVKISSDYYVFTIDGVINAFTKEPNSTLIIHIGRIKNSVIKNLNNKFQVTGMSINHEPIEEKWITPSSFGTEVSLHYETAIAYGFYETNKSFKYASGNELRCSVDNLRVRDSYNLNGKIISKLKKGQEVEIIEAGPYQIINDYWGNWVKIKTANNIEGWCFGAYLDLVIDEPAGP